MTNSRRNEATRQLLIRRSAVYGPMIFLLAVAQCSFFSDLRLFGSVPDLMLGVIVGIAMLDSQKAAAVCGIGAGFVIDALGSSGFSLSPLFYMLCGCLCGMLARKMLPNFLSWAVNLLVFSAAKSVFTAVNIFLLTRAIPIKQMITKIILPEFICTFAVCLPLFFIIKLASLPIEAKSKFRIDRFS